MMLTAYTSHPPHDPSPVPEPTTWALFAFGFALLLVASKMRRRRAQQEPPPPLRYVRYSLGVCDRCGATVLLLHGADKIAREPCSFCLEFTDEEAADRKRIDPISK